MIHVVKVLVAKGTQVKPMCKEVAIQTSDTVSTGEQNNTSNLPNAISENNEVEKTDKQVSQDNSDEERSDETDRDSLEFDEQEEQKVPKRIYLGNGESEEYDPDYDYISQNSYDYDADPNYTGPAYHSLPCKCLRGVSYTPPGHIRRYKYRKRLRPRQLSIDSLFEL